MKCLKIDNMDEKYINEIVEIIDNIKDINKQLNSQNLDIIELQKITITTQKLLAGITIV